MEKQNPELKDRFPKSVGIIMDGNGRWAKKRNLPRSAGHSEGLTAAKRIVRAASDAGVECLTLYTFSTENWKRARDEVGFLFALVKKHLRSEYDFYRENNIRIRHIGDLSALPADLQSEIQEAEKDTDSFTGMTVVLAINYGGRNEICRATKKLVASGLEITEEGIFKALDLPREIDFIIRTGGEKRLSNFLLYQAAYAELFFCDTLWPDYSEEEFLNSLSDFASRNRRFGDAQ